MSTQTIPQQQQQAAPQQGQPQQTLPPQQAPVPGFAPPIQQTQSADVSLWVGNLAPTVDETILFNVFHSAEAHRVSSLKVVRNRVDQTPKYAYINFYSKEEAATALESLKHKEVEGRKLRVMKTIPNRKDRINPKANVYVKNLPLNVDGNTLESTFKQFGEILSCYVPLDSENDACGYGYIQFKDVEGAQEAIKKIDGKTIKGIKEKGSTENVSFTLTVELYKPKEERQVKFTNVFVKNIPKDLAGDDGAKVVELFQSKFGPVTKHMYKVHTNKAGEELPFAFLNFENHEDAEKAIKEMHGKENGIASGWYVSRAEKKSERARKLRQEFSEKKIAFKNNVFVKSLNEKTTEESLREFFKTDKNTIESVKIPVDPEGKRKGYGYIAFANFEEAQEAVNKADKQLDGSKIEAYMHRTREELARSKKNGYFGRGGSSQNVNGVLFTPQQMDLLNMMFLRWTGVGNFPNQQRRAPMPPMSFVPPRMRQQQHRLGRVPGPMNMPPMMPQVMMPMTQAPAAMLQQQMPAMPQQQPVNVHAEADALNNLPKDPQKKREVIGERLFPLVEKIDKDRAPKITGMLLDADATSLVNLIKDEKALLGRVKEAQKVLDEDAGKPAAQ